MVDFEGTEIETGAQEQAPQVPESQPEESAPEAAPQTQTQEQEVPFHEHPRFKELIAEKNQYQNSIREMQEELHRLKSMMPAPEQKVEPIVQKLQGIDPELASRIQKTFELERTVQSLQQQQAQSQQEFVRTQVNQSLQSLYTENKVDEALKPFYEARLEKLAAKNPNAKLSDLPTYFKEVHDSMSKWVDSIKRTDRQNYVVDKKTDAKAPTAQPKGQAAKPAPSKMPADAELARAEVVKSALSKWRAGKTI